MTVHNLYTVGTQAIEFTPSQHHSGLDITIQNVNPSGYLYVGGEGVSSSNYGYRILPNHAISLELPADTHLYVVGSTSNLSAAVLYVGLESSS